MSMELSGWINRIKGTMLPRRLPPGEMIDIDVAERHNRQLLMDLAAEHGPVFKGRMEGLHTTCIVGLALGRRFLKAHGERLQLYTLNISSIVPFGFIRQMQGAIHRRYRAEFARALAKSRHLALLAEAPTLEVDILDAYAKAGGFGADAYIERLGEISARVLIRALFGSSSDPFEKDLYLKYMDLGPFGLVWNPGPAQMAACKAIDAHLRSGLANGLIDPRSVLGAAASLGEVDATLLGNFIYMVEMGRYDVRNMYRTLSVYAANNAERMTLIRHEHATGGERYARAFVDEELRTDQSERLMRRVLTDISFEGWHLPAGSLARVCMWESHHDPDLFPQPMRFDPDRLLGSSKGGETCSPFGLDRHQCPFADLVGVAGIRFLRALTHFDLRSQGDQTMMRGAYHWEPGHDFSLQIRRRDAV